MSEEYKDGADEAFAPPPGAVCPECGKECCDCDEEEK